MTMKEFLEKLKKIAENEQKVHDAGYTKGVEFGNELGYNNGYNNGYTEGFDAGKQAEYDAFWDVFQNYGKTNSYFYKFIGSGGGETWTDANYNPKYEIDCTGSSDNGAYSVFYGNKLITDIKVPMNCRGNKMQGTFHTCTNLIRIPLIRVNENTEFPGNTFQGCASLIDVTFEGIIGKSGLNLQWSTKLSKDSITSVINALSTTTSGLSITLSKTAREAAFLNDEWEQLILRKPNWTINLV